MIRLFLFCIKDLFTKSKPEPKDYIHLVKKFEDGRYLCVINGMVRTVTSTEYKAFLKRITNDNTNKQS